VSRFHAAVLVTELSDHPLTVLVAELTRAATPGTAQSPNPCGEYDGIEYRGLPIKPIPVRYPQKHQGISDTPELPIIHQVRDAPMKR
jgi:hypothetical protein